MEEKVLETINKYNLIQANDKLVLGVSGGPDSLFMLDVLLKLKERLKIELFVAHVNHMIREEADEEEEFVRKFCKNKNVMFFSKKVNVEEYAEINKIGTEEAGRKVRYDFFDEVLKNVGANKIAIAHNKNDKVETIIMHLLRGTGLSGLQGIEPIKNGKIIRPIIEIERDEIEKYCKDNNLEPRIDKTNFNNIYTRNKIRNIVIPYIKNEFNPNIINTITRLSEVISAENRFLERLTIENYNQILVEENENQIVLKLKEFNRIDEVLKNRIVLYTISKLRGSGQGIEKVHIKDIIKLCENNIGNKYLTPNKGLKISLKNKKIYFEKI